MKTDPPPAPPHSVLILQFTGGQVREQASSEPATRLVTLWCTQDPERGRGSVDASWTRWDESQQAAVGHCTAGGDMPDRLACCSARPPSSPAVLPSRGTHRRLWGL